MGIYINPNNQAFRNAVNSEIYVDKTELLIRLNKAICTEQRCICVSRPRRFGKSMAANMVLAYYSKGCDSKLLFQRYRISRHADFEKYLNKYHVIHFDTASFLCRAKQPEIVVRLIDQALLRGFKKEFPDMIDDTFQDTFSAIIEIYENTQAQFIIIIDEWDCVIREEMGNAALVKEYLDFLRGLFKSAESQDFLALGYMTGILPVKKFGSESALNNFYEYTMTEPGEFAEYFGFTQDEADRLCRDYQMDQHEVRKWYDGYCFGRFTHIYNPNSLIQAILKQAVSCYWKNTAAFENLNRYISCNFEGLKDDILSMLVGEQRRINVNTFRNDLSEFSNKDDVLTVLVHLGYLTYNADTQMAFIPNEEVRMAFASAIQVGNWKEAVEVLEHSRMLLEATIRQDEKVVAEEIKNSQMQYASIIESKGGFYYQNSIIEFNDENALSCAVMMAYFAAREYYTVLRELPAGEGFADIAFIPRPNVDKPALLVELKWNHSANTAISQIRNKQYTGGLVRYQENLLLVGISYHKKKKLYSCKIERY